MADPSDIDFGQTVRGFAAEQKVFGRYVLTRILGRGGMGVVWLARDQDLERDVALKFLPEILANDRAAVADLKRETRRSLELTHANIVRVYDFVQDSSLAAISMEYINGRTLDDLRQERPHGIFEASELNAWLPQLCGALDYAHQEARVVHRDLKPANVMVDIRGRIKIADFGISSTVSETVTRVTNVIGTSGTLTYMSPQQMFGRTPTPSDDIYSLGATLYEMLSGKPPFFRGNVPLQVEREAPPPVAQRRKETGVAGAAIPEAWERTLAACLAKEPEKRPASAADVLAAITGVKGAPTPIPGLIPPPARPAPGAKRAWSGLRTALTATAVALFAIAGAGGYYFGFHLPKERRVAAEKAAVEASAQAKLQAQADDASRRESEYEALRNEEARVAALQRAEEEKRAEAERVAELKKQEEAKRLAEQKEQEEAKRLADQKEQDEAKRLAEQNIRDEKERRAAEARDAEVRAAATRAAEEKRLQAAAEEARVAAEAAEREETLRRAEAEKRGTDAGVVVTDPGTTIETPPPPPPEFVIQLDPPVRGARVWLGPRADIAVGSSGRLVLRDLPTGEHELMVQAPGYELFTSTVSFGADGGSQRVTLTPLKAIVRVRGRPGTRVTAREAGGQTIVLGVIAEDGTLTNDSVLPAGRYTLRFEHPDCAPVEQAAVELSAGRASQITPAQRPLPGELRVLSSPEGAEVRVNGVVAGRTPLTLNDQPSEIALRVEVARPGFRAFAQEITLRPRGSGVVNASKLVAETVAVDLRIANVEFGPGQGQARLDGKDVQPVRTKTGGWRLESVVPGEHKLEIAHPDYEPWTQSFTATEARDAEVRGELVPKSAKIQLHVEGSPVFSLTVDGEPATLVSGAVNVPAGRDVRLEVGARGFRPVQRTVRLAPNALERWDVPLARLDRPTVGQPFVVTGLALAMLHLYPGEFVMGSTKTESGPGSDEQPLTRVRLTRAFWLGETEVTQTQWRAVMGSNPSQFQTAGGGAPVERVSWEDAMNFCRTLTRTERAAGRLQTGYAYTLPTEAQWEYACRAGTSGPLPGVPTELAWFSERSTKPVAQKRANPWGFYDMHGNVSEWTASWYGPYPGGTSVDYAGPPMGTVRVFRGGAWESNSLRTIRSAYRNWVSPGTRTNSCGFRLAVSATPAR